jgi:hypothetical protein
MNAVLWLLVLMVFGVALWGCAIVWSRTRDSLHPLIIAAGVAVFFAGYQPAVFMFTGDIGRLLTISQAIFVMLVNAVFLTAFVGGSVLATPHSNFKSGPPLPKLSEDRANVLFALGLTVGLLGMAFRIAALAGVGGFTQAYSRSYGGATTDDSGWLRDAWYLCFSGVILMVLSSRSRRIGFLTWASIALVLSPHLVHTVLGARRGPLFVVVVVTALAYYFTRQTRPKLGITLIVGFLLGVAMLALIANRDRLYLGSRELFEDTRDVRQSYAFKGGEGAEFLAGGAKVVAADALGKYGLGVEWVEVLFLRPIPKEILPDKYQILPHEGVTMQDITAAVGWTPGEGFADTFLLELFSELSWFGVVFAFAAGWLITVVWRRAVFNGSFMCAALYVCAGQGLLHLMAQDFKAWLVPFLIIAAPVLAVVWATAPSALRVRRQPEFLSGVPVRSGR